MPRDLLFPSPRYEVDRLFDTLVHTVWSGEARQRGWCPPVDVTEESDRYRIDMDLPGVTSSEVAITAQQRMLRIEGRRSPPRHSSEGRSHLMERASGSFTRTFRLPDDADPEGIRARLDQGVLTVEIPKKGGRTAR